MTILETERLILRHFNLGDLDEIYRLVYADPAVKDTWSGATGTPNEIKARFAERHILVEGDFCLRALALKDTSTLIGLMGFQRHAPGEGRDIWYLQSESSLNRRVGFDPNYVEVELTYALGRAYWKQGYATEMGRALVAYGFDKLGIGRILQGVRSDNPNSVNLMRRLGFRIENGLDPGEVVGILEPEHRSTADG
jgi:[ribosomal protein S5]-alanine N-acetyltransferase